MQETLRQLHSVCGQSHASLLADDVQQLVNYSIVNSFLQHASTNESFIWTQPMPTALTKTKCFMSLTFTYPWISGASCWSCPVIYCSLSFSLVFAVSVIHALSSNSLNKLVICGAWWYIDSHQVSFVVLCTTALFVNALNRVWLAWSLYFYVYSGNFTVYIC